MKTKITPMVKRAEHEQTEIERCLTAPNRAIFNMIRKHVHLLCTVGLAVFIILNSMKS
ncbi:hypothetical protein [Vibrio sp. B183]|uniref:hypothetical protein n=1 Tax=Vibrio sp. B183 TaxID=1526762 RepID=UPI001362E903|nr:hypothetical protein [Vibrio sp. B183]